MMIWKRGYYPQCNASSTVMLLTFKLVIILLRNIWTSTTTCNFEWFAFIEFDFWLTGAFLIGFSRMPALEGNNTEWSKENSEGLINAPRGLFIDCFFLKIIIIIIYMSEVKNHICIISLKKLRLGEEVLIKWRGLWWSQMIHICIADSFCCCRQFLWKPCSWSGLASLQ